MRFAKKLMAAEGKTNYELISYEGLGHLIDLPFFPPCTLQNHPMLPYPMKLWYGGTNKQLHAQSQEEVWSDTLRFFSKCLI